MSLYCMAAVLTLLAVAPKGWGQESSKLDFKDVPGVVIAHLPATNKVYIGSPSLVVWTNGDYLASHDYFGSKSSRDHMTVYRSKDRGATWQRLTELTNQYWSTLFLHREALYLMGGTTETYGNTVIRKSTDGGVTWTTPADANTGLLLGDGKYHCAPVPVLVHEGRIWRAMEDSRGGDKWGPHFRAFMMSAPENTDLLKAANWVVSNRLQSDTTNWLSGEFNGWLEGNAVADPAGNVLNILRVDVRSGPEKAAVVRVRPGGVQCDFDPASGFIDFPGGAKKFTIRRDPVTKLYWSLVNYVPAKFRDRRPAATRNTLAMVCSSDVIQWSVRAILLCHPDPEKHGFQYVDWLFDGQDIIATCRTAFDDGLGGAHNHHDANFLTFHRFTNFRQLQTDESMIK